MPTQHLDRQTALFFVLKVASRCNLNCSYCYVYNKGDATWKTRPAFMSDEVLDAALERIRGWCVDNRQRRVNILFHGGEPLLAGPRQFDSWCERIVAALSGTAEVDFIVQTNAVLIDEEWIGVFRKHQISVGVSIDGPREVHDRFRLTHAGKGSYDAVVTGIGRLRDAGMSVDVLCVIPLGADGARVQREFVKMGARRISYLLPDFTHDTMADLRAVHGDTPCADFLIPAFDAWWRFDTLDVLVEPFLNMTRLIMGGASILDSLGNHPFGYVFIEADGTIEGLDILRVCGEGTCNTGLNVLRDDFRDVAALPQPEFRAIFSAPELPDGCRSCPEEETCSGGYFPHRWSKAAGFNNPSVWCRDLTRIFEHIRSRLDVSHEETRARRAALNGAPSC